MGTECSKLAERKGDLKILFFSKGFGRGHAMPDLAIANLIHQYRPNITLQFVSYGTGAATIRAHKCDVIDLGMPDNNPLLETIVHCIKLVVRLGPTLIVTHEEIAPLLAAQAFDTPCLFITDYFQEPPMLTTKILEFAEEVIFTGDAGVFTEPPALQHLIRYVGPAVRPLKYRRSDRDKARQELKLPLDGTVVSCMPGNWTESGSPIADVLIAAFDQLPVSGRFLIWLAGRDFESLHSRLGTRSDIFVVKESWDIDCLMVASDVVVTKSNRMTLHELHALGIPSLALSHGANWPDDVVANRIPTNRLLDARDLDATSLTACLMERIEFGKSLPPCSEWPRGTVSVAERICEHLDNASSGCMNDSGMAVTFAK